MGAANEKENFFHVVTEEDEISGLRFDLACVVLFPDLSRSKLAKGISEGAILRNGKPDRPKTPIKTGDVFTWYPDFFTIPPLQPEPFTIPILYEDEDLMVLNKPANRVTHPTESLREGTVVNELLGSRRRLAETGDANRPGIVHRLDAQTSGCLVVVKNGSALEKMTEAFRMHEVKKHYLTMVEGRWETEGTMIQKPLGRDPRNAKRRAIRADGKPAQTLFVTREAHADASLMDVRIDTGRTHQIRVHAADQKHPVIGDRLYGYRKQRHETSHQLLHAWQIAFFHPRTGDWIHVTAPWDLEFTRCLTLYGFATPEVHEPDPLLYLP